VAVIARSSRRKRVAAAAVRLLCGLTPAKAAPRALALFVTSAGIFVLYMAFMALGPNSISTASGSGQAAQWPMQTDWNGRLWLEVEPPLLLAQLPPELRGQRGEIYSAVQTTRQSRGLLPPLFEVERRYFRISLHHSVLTKGQMDEIQSALRKHDGQLPPALRDSFRRGDHTRFTPIFPTTESEALAWFLLLFWWAFVAVAALTVFLWLGGRWTIERVVLRLGYCPNCCYPRDGLVGMQCPECGHWTRRVNRAALLRSPPICPSPSPPNPSSSPAPPPA